MDQHWTYQHANYLEVDVYHRTTEKMLLRAISAIAERDDDDPMQYPRVNKKQSGCRSDVPKRSKPCNQWIRKLFSKCQVASIFDFVDEQHGGVHSVEQIVP